MGAEIYLILLGWAIAGGSPGPATLAITGTSVNLGRRSGLAIASGVLCGSAAWGIAAALGLSAIMMANAWMFEVIRYAGALYLLYLAIKSLRSAMFPKPATHTPLLTSRLFAKGMLLHLTNPKAILAWGSIYAIALPMGADATQVWSLFGMLISVSALMFLGYAILFSSAPIARGYLQMRRAFDVAFGVLFGLASLKLLTTRLT